MDNQRLPTVENNARLWKTGNTGFPQSKPIHRIKSGLKTKQPNSQTAKQPTAKQPACPLNVDKPQPNSQQPTAKNKTKDNKQQKNKTTTRKKNNNTLRPSQVTR